MTSKPVLVSIITITYNSASTIEDTLLSILEQTYATIQYIIVDGESDDGTLQIIDSYERRFLEKGIALTVQSEKDKGIADAWNKGLRLAKGDIIGLLNSDDWYDRHAIEQVSQLLDPQKKQLSYGICRRVDENKSLIETMEADFNPRRVYMDFRFSHTTCFVTKKTYEVIGHFNDDYKIAMDVDFLLRCIKGGVLFKKANNITYMRIGGISTFNRHAALLEHQTALKNNGYNRLLIFISGFLKKLILLIKK